MVIPLQPVHFLVVITLFYEFIYSDELEVCNLLGSSKAKRKLTCVYFLLGNVPTRYLSSLCNIFLLAVMLSASVKMLSYDVVL